MIRITFDELCRLVRSAVRQLLSGREAMFWNIEGAEEEVTEVICCIKCHSL